MKEVLERVKNILNYEIKCYEEREEENKMMGNYEKKGYKGPTRANYTPGRDISLKGIKEASREALMDLREAAKRLENMPGLLNFKEFLDTYEENLDVLEGSISMLLDKAGAVEDKKEDDRTTEGKGS